MSVVDPADESVITTQVPAATSEDVDLAVAAAARAFKVWGKTTGAYVLAAARLRLEFSAARLFTVLLAAGAFFAGNALLCFALSLAK